MIKDLMKKCLLIFLLLTFTACDNTPKRVALPDDTYNQSQLKEFNTYQEIEDKMTSNEAFIIFVYNNFCDACLSFEPVLNQFIEERQLTIYSIENSLIQRDSWLDKQVKTTPTVLIISEQKKIAQLDPNDGEHTSYFETVEGFGIWFDEYIISK
ncbi:MAG: thioredoxin family protein [Bacilli bacterium]|nr:thioredoxin family protein [Bacilli bacterium]